MVLLRPGYVIKHQCGTLLVLHVGDSGATCVRNGVRKVSYETTGGTPVSFETTDKHYIHLSAFIERDWIIETGVDVSQHIKRASHLQKYADETSTAQTTTKKENISMTKTKQSFAKVPKPIKNPRGGLAADIKQVVTATPEVKPAKLEKPRAATPAPSKKTPAATPKPTAPVAKKKAAAKNGAPAGAGRSAYIRELCATKMTPDEIVTKTQAKFENTGRAHTLALIDRVRKESKTAK